MPSSSSRRIRTTVLGAGVFCGLLWQSQAEAQPLVHHDLQARQAIAMAQKAIEACTAQHYAISVVVVDRAGETLVSVRGDEAGAYTLENARRKAYTALAFKTPTAAYAKRFVDNDPAVRQQVSLPSVIASAGGLPIRYHDEVIGGIGVSGTPGVDEMCTQAGIAAMANELK